MRIITAEERRALPRPVVPSGASRKIARAKAIERELASYVHLKCGHLTTREEIEFFQVWQTKPHHYYCENCGKWIDEDLYSKSLPAIELDELPF